MIQAETSLPPTANEIVSALVKGPPQKLTNPFSRVATSRKECHYKSAQEWGISDPGRKSFFPSDTEIQTKIKVLIDRICAIICIRPLITDTQTP